MAEWLDKLVREQVAGLDIGEHHAAVAFMVRHQGKPALAHLGLTEFDADADERTQARTLRDLWRRTGIHTCTVCVSLRSPSLLLKYFRYEGLEEAELPSALRLEAEASLQADQRDLLMDWQITSRRKDGGGPPTLEGVLVAAPLPSVQRLQRLLSRAGLYPVICDVAGMALANLALTLRPPSEQDGPLGVAHLGEQSAELVILDPGGDVYPRTLLARSAQPGESLRYLLGGIEDNLKYYMFKLHERAVSRLLFTGLVRGREDILGQFRGAGNAAVEFWNPLEGLPTFHTGAARQARSLQDQGSLLAPALGLALRGLP